jgi:hypothetical protein
MRTRASIPSVYRVALWVLLGAKLIAGWGVQWDIQWHVRIGRDTFWIPPHVMTYSGVAILVLASFGVLARDTRRHLLAGRAPEGTERVLGLTGTPGFLLAACGIALTVLAAPIDDLWHRLFGIDVTLWEPAAPSRSGRRRDQHLGMRAHRPRSVPGEELGAVRRCAHRAHQLLRKPLDRAAARQPARISIRWAWFYAFRSSARSSCRWR